LDSRLLGFWGDSPYPILDGNAHLAQRMYEKDDGQAILPLLDSGCGGFGHGDLGLTPLLESRIGTGTILACQLNLSEKLSEIPVAEELLLNMLTYLADYQPPKTERFQIVEADADISAALAQAADGATIIVNALSETDLAAWGAALKVSLQKVDVGEIYQAIRDCDDKLLDGVSNEDTCGVHSWTYAGKKTNYRIAKLALAPTAGLEPLLVTPAASCLKELFVYDGKTEPLRTHTVSRFTGDERPDSGIVLGRVRHGRGKIIFNQFIAPQNADTHFYRLEHRLLANLGIICAHSILDGDCVTDVAASSPGYPERVAILNKNADRDTEKTMIELTRPSSERMAVKLITTSDKWVDYECPEGTLSAQTLDPEMTTYIYYILNSPVARKNVDQDIGVPNPEALSFLDLTGNGVVKLFVNGAELGCQSLNNDTMSFSDIELEMGINHILLKWSPENRQSHLRSQWRDIMRNPEAEFSFL
jgi:hypothetical protein